jgi:hypothetical protein
MDKITKSTLKIQIEAYLTKFADPTLKDVKKWLFEGTTTQTSVPKSVFLRPQIPKMILFGVRQGQILEICWKPSRKSSQQER